VFKNGGHVRVSGYQISYQSVRRDLDLYALWKFDPKRQLRVALSNVLNEDFLVDNKYQDERIGTQTRSVIFPNSVRVRATYELKF
jgi:hypothetical protein